MISLHTPSSPPKYDQIPTCTIQREAETDNLPKWQTFAGLEHAIAGGMVHNRPTLNHLLLELFGLEMKVIVCTQDQSHRRHHLHLLHCHLLDGTDPPLKRHKHSYWKEKKSVHMKFSSFMIRLWQSVAKCDNPNLKLTDSIHANENLK
jgi:hypothetical protein